MIRELQAQIKAEVERETRAKVEKRRTSFWWQALVAIQATVSILLIAGMAFLLVASPHPPQGGLFGAIWMWYTQIPPQGQWEILANGMVTAGFVLAFATAFMVLFPSRTVIEDRRYSSEKLRRPPTPQEQAIVTRARMALVRLTNATGIPLPQPVQRFANRVLQ